MLATILIFGSFIGLAAVFFLVLVPMLWNQTISLLSDLPAMFNKSNEWLLNLPKNYPELIDYSMVDSIFNSVREKNPWFWRICCKTFFSLYYELSFLRNLCLF